MTPPARTSSKEHLPFFADPATPVGQFILDLIDYQKTRTLENNFIGSRDVGNGMWQYLSATSRIFPSYMLHRTVTGRCLTSDSRVVTNRGAMTIREIGEFLHTRGTPLLVLTHNNNFKRVTEFVLNGNKVVYRLTTSGGRTLKATANHPLWTREGWRTVDNLHPGAKVYAFDFDFDFIRQILNGKRRKPYISPFVEDEIISIEAIGRLPTYDISVEDDHSFIAEGLVVHNTASAEPNGQNFPKRGQWAKPYQSIFKASPGYKLVNCDLSQIELRIAAWMANEPTMLRIYREGGDIHTATAKYVNRLTDEQWNALSSKQRKELRTKAKAVNAACAGE